MTELDLLQEMSTKLDKLVDLSIVADSIKSGFEFLLYILGAIVAFLVVLIISQTWGRNA